MTTKISDLRLNLDEPEDDLAAKAAARIKVAPDAILGWRILRKSIDARRHDDIHFEYALAVELEPADQKRILDLADPRVSPYQDAPFSWPEPGATSLEHRPVVIGLGPAGLFAGYFLAQSGFAPLILERGRSVKDRVADVRAFEEGGPVDPESNYLFGEGGAGAFSDGKLTYRGAGPDVDKVLEILADCHGKPSIRYEHRPHLGSNRLPLIVRTLRRKIESMGGEVRFSCRVEDLDVRDGRLRGLMTSSGPILADLAILAVGHSARDVYGMLLRRHVPLEAKPFQFGVRIEQPQAAIDHARYGVNRGHQALGAADYSVSVRARGRDLFSFCMCAGGYVMASISEPGYFCSNGMSESRHDSPFANSGLVVTIDPAAAGNTHPLAGIHYQQQSERRSYLAGGREYLAPVQWARDLLAGRSSSGPIPSSHRRGARTADLARVIPREILEALESGLPMIDRRFGGRFLRDATITGPESRGSAPVRVLRDPVTRQSTGLAGLYPCGEGAGYAGGIMSAAVDGLRTARSIVAAHAARSI